MPAKFLITQNSAKRNLRKLPFHVHVKIVRVLGRIKENPLIGIKLHGDLQEYYKFRVGDYRIVYKFDKKTSITEAVRIEHRQGVYR